MAKPEFKGYSDIIMHSKENVDGSTEERIVFPVTRYDNVLNAPHVSDDPTKSENSEFILMTSEEVEMDSETVYSLIGKRW